MTFLLAPHIKTAASSINFGGRSASPEGRLIGDAAWKAMAGLSGASAGGWSIVEKKPELLDEQLFNSAAAFKVAAANYAMHFEKGWRDRLFAQLDALLDRDEWDSRDIPPLSQSAVTFLRLLVFLRSRRPALGATADGHLVASWTNGANSLTVYCLPNDALRWIVTFEGGEGRETAVGTTHARRLPEVLAPYKPEQWFLDAE